MLCDPTVGVCVYFIFWEDQYIVIQIQSFEMSSAEINESVIAIVITSAHSASETVATE